MKDYLLLTDLKVTYYFASVQIQMTQSTIQKEVQSTLDKYHKPPVKIHEQFVLVSLRELLSSFAE